MMPLTSLFNLFRFHVKMLNSMVPAGFHLFGLRYPVKICISVDVLQKQVPPEFCCSCHVFDSMLVLAMFFLLNHNGDLALALVARESLWIPASMNGTFFMVS